MGIMTLGWSFNAKFTASVVLPQGATIGNARMSAVVSKCSESPGLASLPKTVTITFSGGSVSHNFSCGTLVIVTMGSSSYVAVIFSLASCSTMVLLVMIFT